MTPKKPLYVAIATAAVSITISVIVSAVFAASPNFVPEVVFKGSSLTGWHKWGQAEWRADNGEIISAPKEGGGWRMLDKGYQDIYASFQCACGCQTGVLQRAEKTADGTKGIYVSLAGSDFAGYDVLLDALGKETSRTLLGPGPGMARMGAARFSGAEDLVPGFAKPAPTRAEALAAAAAAAARPPAAAAGGAGRGARPPLSVPKTGTPEPRGGPIATAGGVIFLRAAIDRRFRALDAKTGKELWVANHAESAKATPITYQGKDGKQHVAIVAAAGDGRGADTREGAYTFSH